MTIEMPKEEAKIHYIYCITCIVNNKTYIGQTIQPNRRWNQHRNDAARPVMPIQFAIKKHGAKNFIFEIIASCKGQNNANDLETELVKQYASFISNGKGYNATHGGMNAPKSEAWKQIMRDLWKNPEYKTKMLKLFSIAYQTKTPEEKAEHIANIKITKAQWTEEYKKDFSQRIAATLTGIPHTEERRKNQSEARLGVEPWNKGLKFHSEPKLGPKINTGQFEPNQIPWNKGIHVINDGTFKSGSRHPSAKINEAQVLNILELYKGGMKKIEISRTLEINKNTVYDILNGRTWADITGIKKI